MLPIEEILPALTKELAANSTVILQAPPGAGKSTLLPVKLMHEKWLEGKKILLLQPRRLAAITVATRLAFLLDEQVGKKVGYRIRFENKISAETKIEVVTEGILTRLLQQDNSLEGVGLVIFDEFHERSLHADLALVLCREMQQVLRNDLKILVMSATLNADELVGRLGRVPVITSQGRQYPIQYHYANFEENINLSIQVTRLIKRALKEKEGDVLVFLPGVGEIFKVQELLEKEFLGVKIAALYGDLPQQRQQEAIMPDQSGRRKVVLATSIAETSITIEGIKIVVDSGFARVPRFDPRSGLTRLETVKVTLDSANQRAGRAGRLGPGDCYRLWSEGKHLHLLPSRAPEILEADLTSLVLEVAQWGITDIQKMEWITLPPNGSVNQATILLQQLEALEDTKITERGKEMLRFPTHPRIAHMLMIGKETGLLPLATDVAAVLEERDPLPTEVGVNLAERVEALRKWRSKEWVSAEKTVLQRIERLALFWRKLMKIDPDNQFPDYLKTGKLLSAAYPERVARQKEKHSNKYRLVNGRIAQLQESDPLIAEEWLSVAHLDAGKGEGKIYLAAPLDPKDIIDHTTKKEIVSWDSQQGVLIARTERRLGEIIVETAPIANVSEEKKIEILLQVIRAEGLKIFNWTEKEIQWQARVMNVRSWKPDEEWPNVSEEGLFQSLLEWAAPFIGKVKRREDFHKLNLFEMLSCLLSWEKSQQLDLLAPERLSVPSGSTIKLEYFTDGRQPVLAVRLQELFGLADTPQVNNGRTKVLLHLLSPGYKPVQVTQDLRSFWNTTYQEVKKQLKVRYPKHSWPEDPWTAEAVRGAKKRNPQ